jgi:hypothetical protein
LVERVGYHQNCDVRSYKAEWKKQNKTRLGAGGEWRYSTDVMG